MYDVFEALFVMGEGTGGKGLCEYHPHRTLICVLLFPEMHILCDQGTVVSLRAQ